LAQGGAATTGYQFLNFRLHGAERFEQTAGIHRRPTQRVQGELNLVWEHLWPAIQPQALPANNSSAEELQHKLLSLSLAPPKAQPTSPTAARVSGKTFRVETNDSGVQNLKFHFAQSDCVFTLTDNQGSYPITCGIEKWVPGETSMPGTPPKLTKSNGITKSKIAASCTWRDEQTFEMTRRFIETPHHDTVTCRFNGEELKVEFMNSVTQLAASRKESRPPLTARMA